MFSLAGYINNLNKVKVILRKKRTVNIEWLLAVSALVSPPQLSDQLSRAVTLSLGYDTWFGMDQTAIWWQIGYNGFLSLWRQHRWALPGTYICASSGFAFSACHVSAGHIISEFTECLIYNHGNPNIIAFDQRLHFSAKEVKKLAGEHEIYWSCDILLLPESSVFMGSWHGPQYFVSIS